MGTVAPFTASAPPAANTPTSIETVTGRFFDLARPRAEDVSVEDIAWSLAHQCRYVGHLRRHYSVAQHSVLVSRLVEVERGGPAAILWGLLHDAPEAYLGDLSGPMKQVPALGTAYEALERPIFAAVAEAFRLEALEPPALVYECDRRVLCAEVRDLKGNATWARENARLSGLTPWPWRIRPQAPYRARREFLARYRALTEAGR